MSKQKIKTIPDLSEKSPAHIEARKSGDGYLWLWTRNVIDEFKELSNEEIKNKLRATAFPYAVLAENFAHDMNHASLIRNANAFNARKVYYIGDRRLSKRGSQGVQNYTEIEWLPTVEDCVKLKKQYKFIAIDNVPGAKSLEEFVPEPNMMFVFGSEGVGITPEMLKMCDEVIYIKQFGSVRSINVATASGIVMQNYISRLSQ